MKQSLQNKPPFLGSKKNDVEGVFFVSILVMIGWSIVLNIYIKLQGEDELKSNKL
jgi:hypothetical protein